MDTLKVNRSKKQQKEEQGWIVSIVTKFKTIGITIILGIILLSTLTNITNQLYTLVKVQRDNELLRGRILRLEEEEKILKDKLKAASESAYLEGLKRELLGVGTENDYWVKLPEEKNLEEVYPETYKAENTSNFSKWLQMFTD